MSRWERWSFNTLHAVVAATGVAYFSVKYLIVVDDPFAVINHPWQPTLLAAHVVAAPLFIALFGIVFRSHTLRKLLSPIPSNRRTGWTSLVSFSAMALSGYLLQVASDPTWLRVLVWTHVLTSGAFVVGYGAHLIIGWRMMEVPAVSEPDPSQPRPARLPL